MQTHQPGDASQAVREGRGRGQAKSPGLETGLQEPPRAGRVFMGRGRAAGGGGEAVAKRGGRRWEGGARCAGGRAAVEGGARCAGAEQRWEGRGLGREGRAGAGARRSGLATVWPRCLAPQPTRRSPFLWSEASPGFPSCVPGAALEPGPGPRARSPGPWLFRQRTEPPARARPKRSLARGGDAAGPALEGVPRPRCAWSRPGLPPGCGFARALRALASLASCPPLYRRVPAHWTQTRGLCRLERLGTAGRRFPSSQA